jgi:formiminoglutamase
MQKPTLPFILSLPHGGMEAPRALRALFALDPTAIYNEADLWVEALYDFGAAESVERGLAGRHTADVTRGAVDVNRSPLDLDDPDGAIKDQTSYGVAVWERRLTAEEKLSVIAAHWSGWHEEMGRVIAGAGGTARLFLDCHSMAQRGPTTYAFAGESRPFICLANLGGRDGEPLPGGEPVTCPPALLRAAGAVAEDLFADMSLLEPDGARPAVVALNWPFAGGYNIRRYTLGCAPTPPALPPAQQLPMGLMIEVNRGLYVGNQHAVTPPAPPNGARIAAIRNRLATWADAVAALLLDYPDDWRSRTG